MIKEFEQQNEQELALLLDPWLPRTKVAPELRKAMEQASRSRRRSAWRAAGGRAAGWSWGGPAPPPGICQGPASVKLLAELLRAVGRAPLRVRGKLAALFDTLPAPSCATRS